MVEQGFDTIYSQMYTMTTHMGLHENLKTVIWPKFEKLENNMVKPHEENEPKRSSTVRFHNMINA